MKILRGGGTQSKSTLSQKSNENASSYNLCGDSATENTNVAGGRDCLDENNEGENGGGGVLFLDLRGRL